MTPEDFEDDDVLSESEEGVDAVMSNGAAGGGSDGDDGDDADDGVVLKDDVAAAVPVTIQEERLKTSEEVFREAEMTSDASVLQLEVNELLSETRIDYSAETSLDRFLSKLKKALLQIPEHQVEGSSASGFIRDLGLKPEEVSFLFKPPVTVTVVGSYALHTVAKPEMCVDVAVEIPEACLFKKAPLNYRYHARRALYLAAISEHLSTSFTGLELCAIRDDQTRPALLLRSSAGADEATVGPSGRKSKPDEQQKTGKGSFKSPAGFAVRILPVAGPDAFTAAKLAPDRNNLRWVVGKPKAAAATAAAAGAGAAAPLPAAAPPLPTPLYNAGVLQDVSFPSHFAFLRSAMAATPRLIDGVLLLKTWARQRGLLGRADALDGHMLTMFMVHLTKQGKLSPVMTPLQMLRTALHALSDPAAGLPKGIAMARDEAASAALAGTCACHPPSIAAFKLQYDVVFVDFSGWLNLAAGMTKSALAQVVSMAKQTLAVLQSPADVDDAFAAALLLRSTPASAFDYVWRVSVPNVAGSETQCRERTAARERELKVESLIRQALSDRARLVRTVSARVAAGQPPARLSQGLPSLDDGGCGEVLVVAHLDATQALRLVDIGPAADDARAAARFRAFWGAKSELRRFQDGKISEAVVWDCSPANRHRVPDRIVEHVTRAHLPAGAVATGCSGALDVVLLQRPPGCLSTVSSGKGGMTPMLDASTGITAFRMMEAALDKLAKQLRAVEGAALKVVGVQSISAASRQTCPFIPLPHPLAGGGAVGAAADRLPRCLEPVEVLVQLEGSGKWPEDPQAFAKTKAALGLQLAAALETGYGHKTVATEDCVDVLMDGFAFRLLFYSQRDELMLAKGPLPAPVRASAAHEGSVGSADAPADRPTQHPLVRSWHHGLVSAATGVNSAIAPTVRLAKRWVGAQMMSNHVADEAVELIVLAAAAASSSTLPPPASRQSGFLRFLELLCSHPWHTRALVVDPERQLSAAQRKALTRTYDTRRGAGQRMPAMYICTAKDLDSRQWTHEHPSQEALQHLCGMASRTLSLLRPLIESGGCAGGPRNPVMEQQQETAWLEGFCAPRESFDAVLLLRADSMPQANRALPVVAGRGRAGAGGGGVLGRRGRRQDALSAEEQQPIGPPEKRARVFLRAFPEKLAENRGPDQLVPELLVGFDPLPLLIAALDERFGHLAVFCADYHGGASVGVKWRASAFLPATVKAVTAHASLPCTLSVCSPGPTLCVPNIVHLLADIKELGQGMILDISLP